jgi:hypothetical protein
MTFSTRSSTQEAVASCQSASEMSAGLRSVIVVREILHLTDRFGT